MRAFLILLALLGTVSHAAPEDFACDHSLGDENKLLAEFRAHQAGLPEAVWRELAWTEHEDYLIARPIDPALHEKISLRLYRNPMTASWDASLRVGPKGFEDWNNVSFAFEAMQKKRFFETGFREDPRPGELAKGIVANFAGDASAGEADVADGFEVLGDVLKALRGQGLKPKLN